jgi:hypothetical protein
MPHVISVGSPYPGIVLKEDGSALELGPDGNLILMIQFNNIRPNELSALQEGFSRYSFYQARHCPTLAAWVFKFPAPVGYLEVPFHAGLYRDGRGQKFLDNWGNALNIYVLDGEIVKLIRLSGLQHHAATTFRETVTLQITEPVTGPSYNAAVDWLYRMSAKEIFQAGKQFRHGTA